MTLGDDEVTLITNPITDESELACYIPRSNSSNGKLSEVTLAPLPGFRRIHRCCGERDFNDNDEDEESIVSSSSNSEEIPTLVPSGSFGDSSDEDDIKMPSGNKVGDLDPPLPWRRLRPPMSRGTSLPMATGHKDARPKSAEFHLDLNQGPSRTKPPSGNKGHVRSPSDGNKNFLSLVRNGGSVRDRLSRDSPQRSPSPNSPSLLQRLGIFGMRRGCSKDKDNIKTSASMELPAEQNNNSNGVDRRTSQSGATGEGRHRSRLRFRKYSAGAVPVIKDENQNQPPSPPIAVFSSDEDISSVPNTPKHNLPLPVATPTSILTPCSSISNPLSATTVVLPAQHQKSLSSAPPPPPPASQPSSATLPPSTLSVVPSGEPNRNTGSSGIPVRTSSYWGNKRPRPISPRLEQEISSLLMSPTKPTAADNFNANNKPLPTNPRPEARTRSETRVRPESSGQSELLLHSGFERRRGSDPKTLIPETSKTSTRDSSKDGISTTSEPSPPAVVTPQKVLSFATRPTLSRLREQSRIDQGRTERTHPVTPEVADVPYTRYRRYGERKHHSADMVEQTTLKEEPLRRAPQSSISEKSTVVTEAQRAYARHRHYTVDVANIIIKTPEGEQEHLVNTPGSTFVASNIERRAGGNHRNIGIDSYRRISPGGAYIVHMSPSRWSRPNSGLELAFNSQSADESSAMSISQSGLRSAYLKAAAVQAAADKAMNNLSNSSTNQKAPPYSAATPTTHNAVSTNQRASYSGTSSTFANHRDSYSGASGPLTNHRGSYSGASGLSTGISVPSNRTQRRTSSDDVTLFHHRVMPGSAIPVSSASSVSHNVVRPISSPSRSDPPAPPEPNRLSSGFPWVTATRRGSRSSSPHASATTPTSLAARPESPMTPHPTSPRRSTPSSPHTSLPPSPATTSPRTSTSVVSSDLVDDFLIGVRRPLGRDRVFSPQDPNRGSITTTATTPTRASEVTICPENGEKTALTKATTDGVCGGLALRRRTPHTSPEKLAGRERPKSESLTVHWADHVTTTPDAVNPSPRRDRRPSRERPKSDLGGAVAVSDTLEHYELRDRVDSLAALPDGKTGPDPRMKTRRMSTPHPIKARSERSPPNQHRARRGKLRRSRSAPDLMDRARRTKRVFQASSSQAGDLAVQPADFSSDEEEEGCDTMSLETASETSSVSSIGRQAILDEIFEEEPPSYVEALWDHVTLDPEELGFRAGEVVEVTDMADKDWWWGKLRDREGWFPATFVRLRANQADTADDFAARVKEGLVDADLVLARYSPNLLSKDQARTNVVNEIMNAEREYVKHLRDVIEGYVEKCRKRPEMFNKEQMETIFSNIEAIYKFSRELLSSLEAAFQADAPQTSQIGNVFLKHSESFAIYSEYCNNHLHACEELRSLQKSKKYQHFFEACRLLQQMIEIPLEGFLLTPVQKICKYPLQLNELLKYTRPEHADHKLLSEALIAMKRIAVLINERKRKMESLQKLEEWQELVQDWESPNLLESSSELIYCGELTKVNSSGWSQERIFFLFDYQIIYCKKDLLWRDIMVYKGRIDIDEAEVIPVEDGKDTQFNVTVRNGFKIYDRSKDKWYLLYARTMADKDRWLKSLEEERQRVELDRQNGFCLEEYRRKMPQYAARQRAHPDTKVKGDKAPKRKVLRMPFPYQHEQLKNIPSHVTLPLSVSSREALLYGQMSNKKRGWNPFSKVKTKR